MLIIHGRGASAGVSVGPLYFYRRSKKVIERYKVSTNPWAEWDRFQKAQQEAVRRMGVLAEKARKESGEDAADLLMVHQLMAQDEDYVDAIRNEILDFENNAEAAVCDTSARFQGMFRSMDDEYMQARAEDVKSVSRAIIDVLMGRVRGGIDSEVPVILAADDLDPAETIQLDKSKVLGIVTATGTTNSHTAILARSMGIPALVSVGDLLKPALEGREVVLDGDTGQLMVDPDEDTRSAALRKYWEEQKAKGELQALRGQEDITRDGVRVKLACNIASLEDLPAVQQNDGHGIGLFRSEFLYLSGNDYPSEEMQFEAYKQALEAMKGQRVIIRTMDIGADKQAAYFGLAPEENPALGLRGLRLSLTRPGVFRTQLRALYRASAFGDLAIMVPMVTSVWEVREIRRMCGSVMADLRVEGISFKRNVPLGIMIETPASVIMSDRLAREADFFSVGTNDLVQYTTACDRQGDGLGRFYDPHHPAVLRMLKMVTDNAHSQGIEVGVCGEMASEPEMTAHLLALGVDELSVSPGMVLRVRNAIRHTHLKEAREMLLKTLMSDSD